MNKKNIYYLHVRFPNSIGSCYNNDNAGVFFIYLSAYITQSHFPGQLHFKMYSVERRSCCSERTWSLSMKHMPVLQQVLGILDLVLCSCDGNNAVLRALQWFINLDGCPRFVTDLLNSLATLADDGASQLESKWFQRSSVLFCFVFFCESHVFFMFTDALLTSFGMVTCVVMTGPPISLYDPLPPRRTKSDWGSS